MTTTSNKKYAYIIIIIELLHSDFLYITSQSLALTTKMRMTKMKLHLLSLQHHSNSSSNNHKSPLVKI